MNYSSRGAENVKIAYIGGGSRGWAWGLMSELARASDMSGEVYLYDIDFESALANEKIGNMYNGLKEAVSKWEYKAVERIDQALVGADFVIISIMPATLDEMESDVHTPEKYGIYQSVGDTTGPGGIVRAMRTIPMFEEIARNIKKYCPNAWVINYTNPMTLCVKTLYEVFPKIKAFGCCHEVFGTQHFLSKMIKEIFGEDASRKSIKVNPVGVNHFTWLTRASYKNIDLFPHYQKFCKKYGNSGYGQKVDLNWMNASFASREKVKMDLFKRFGYIAAAGDRHLAEFCDGSWYLENPQRVEEMGFSLTSVSGYRRRDLADRLEKSKKLLSGELKPEIKNTGEEGVKQMRALLGLCELVTNVNLVNRGQIPNLPIGAVVETNAVFRANSLESVFAGNIPNEIYPLVSRICGIQQAVFSKITKRDVEGVFAAFICDPLVTCSLSDARKLFKEMVLNTRAYLSDFDLTSL